MTCLWPSLASQYTWHWRWHVHFCLHTAWVTKKESISNKNVLGWAKRDAAKYWTFWELALTLWLTKAIQQYDRYNSKLLVATKASVHAFLQTSILQALVNLFVSFLSESNGIQSNPTKKSCRITKSETKSDTSKTSKTPGSPCCLDLNHFMKWNAVTRMAAIESLHQWGSPTDICIHLEASHCIRGWPWVQM